MTPKVPISDSDAGDERGATAAQEQENHQHNQHRREHQRPLDLGQRGADRGRAVHHGVNVDRRRNRGAQLRQLCHHAVHSADDIGIGLPVDDDENRRLAIGHAGVAQVFH
jgi:hypothetical protein